MPIRRRRADAGKARGLRERESGRPFSGDQFQRGADQRLAQIAVMIAARRIALAAIILAPTHVKDTYIRWAEKSMFPARAIVRIIRGLAVWLLRGQPKTLW